MARDSAVSSEGRPGPHLRPARADRCPARATRLHHSRVLTDRVLVTGAACWLGAVLALHGVLVWLFSTPHLPRYWLLLVAILAIPLARLSAAPLSLAWNRHR